jgi:hypothetical protein
LIVVRKKLKIVPFVNVAEKIKHLEIVKKSSVVMLRSLQIRLELSITRNGTDELFRNALNNKIKYYTEQIEEVELKLDQLTRQEEQL